MQNRGLLFGWNTHEKHPDPTHMNQILMKLDPGNPICKNFGTTIVHEKILRIDILQNLYEISNNPKRALEFFLYKKLNH
jgi:hypothetical protein